MARLNDTSGIPHTCPKIDSVIDFLNSLEITEHDEGFTIEDIKRLCETLEEIRSANDGLRTHGSQLQNELDEKEDEIQELNNLNSDLHEEILNLKNEIEQLEEELNEE